MLYSHLMYMEQTRFLFSAKFLHISPLYAGIDSHTELRRIIVSALVYSDTTIMCYIQSVKGLIWLQGSRVEKTGIQKLNSLRS